MSQPHACLSRQSYLCHLEIAVGATNPQAGTQASIPPVILDRCRIDYGGNLVLGSTGKLDVEFTNESSVTADLVRIRVDLLGNVTNVRDVGTFSPGVSVRHRVRNEQGQIMVFPVFGGHKNRAHCAITMVRFVDGTTWVSPSFLEEQQGT